MRIALPQNRSARLTYEMNAHRSETIEEFYAALETFVLPVRACVAPDQPFGLAPRWGRQLLGEFRSQEQRERFRAFLREHTLELVTVNGFPLEDFQAKRVKENVYRPAWTRKERASLTNRIAELMVELIPAGGTATLSTLGGTYRSWNHDDLAFRRIARNYLLALTYLVQLEREHGVFISLAVEPEPDTTFETANDVVDFTQRFLLPQLDEQFARPLRVSREKAEDLFRRFFTVNLDICHLSVLFRDPVAEWRRLEEAGLRVAKLHVSSAIRARFDKPEVFRELMRYDEPQYLHQFAARLHQGSILRGADLDTLPVVHDRDLEEVRVHFHVPVSKSELGILETTQDDTRAALAYACKRPVVPDFAIETYTWPILAPRPEEIVEGIAAEFSWVLAEVAKLR